MDVVGFDGSVGARQLSRLIANVRPAGVGHVLSLDDLKTTAVSGRRAIQIAPGGVQTGFLWGQEPQARTLDFPTPTAGAFHLLVLEVRPPTRDSEGTISPVLMPSETRDSQDAPDSLPNLPGALRARLSHVGSDVWHVPLYWAFVRRRDNAVTLWDLRITRTGMPCSIAAASGTMRYPRGGTGYDAFAKFPAVGFLVGNEADPRHLDMPAGVYDINVLLSIGATKNALGAFRVETFGASGSQDLARDPQNDLGPQRMSSWGRTISHPGGKLAVRVSHTVNTPDGSDVAGTIQNGTGHLELRYRTRFPE